MILTTPLDGQPLTRRRARALARPRVSAFAESSTAEAVLADASTGEIPGETSTAEAALAAPSLGDARAKTSTAEPALGEPIVEQSTTVEPVLAEQTSGDESTTAEPVIVESAETLTAVPLLTDFELLEPPASDSAADAEAEEPPVSADEFDVAARLFSFTGETPVQAPAEAHHDVGEHVAEHVAKGRKRPARVRLPGSSFKRMAAASFSVGAMAVVGLMTVGLTMPVEAVAAVGTSSLGSPAPAGDVFDPDSGEIQAYVAPAAVTDADLSRSENYSAGTLVDLAGTVGISNFSSSVFTNNPACKIQWPFAVGVTMSYGFGMRSGTMHEGIDFTPGEGAHIQAIADGVVRIATDSGGAYGVTIVIDHVIDGQLVSSRYAHMQYGTRQVEVGDTVSVGQFIGQTGNTGYSFGAHTHFEILAGGTTAIDPLPWLQEHTVC